MNLRFHHFVLRLAVVGLLSTALTPYALAASNAEPTARYGFHADKTRLVFEWKNKVDYTLTPESDGSLILKFKKAGTFKPVDQSKQEDSNLYKITLQSKQGDDLTLKIIPKIPSKSNDAVHDFRLDNKIVIDIAVNKTALSQWKPSDANKKSAETAPLPAEQKQPEIKPAPEKETIQPPKAEEPVAPITPTAPIAPAPDPTKLDIPLSLPPAPTAPTPKAPAAAPLPAASTNAEKPNYLKSEMAALQTDVILLSGRDEVKSAVFQRDGILWLISNQEGESAPPTLKTQTTRWQNFERAQSDKGAAWYVPIPKSLLGKKISVAGGGLTWRIIISNKANMTEVIEPERITNPIRPDAGGVLQWRFNAPDAAIQVDDPFFLDRMIVIPVGDYRDYTGFSRQFSELKSLDSALGLALLPKVDDLSIAIAEDGRVQATRPKGLSLTAQNVVDRMMLSERLSTLDKKDQEGLISEEISHGVIFELNEWKMGGRHQLGKNKNLLMQELADQDGQIKATKAMMLARMHLANDRAPEAMGFLRLAKSQDPDLGDAPVFQALEGAARAISGQDDGAILDFEQPALSVYPEIQYWKSYALAGAGKWDKAFEILPAQADFLLQYPSPLREKLALRLAETALRGGKLTEPETATSRNISLAQDYLSVIRPLLKQERAPLWAKAGYQYLRGMMYHHDGDTDKALSIWKGLARSPDKFYRVKANFAAIQLGYKTKTLKADEAIDKLERLRYAWRGDDLEHQIGHALGNLYIDHGYYLKGFSILRDTIASATDHKDIADAITHDMTVRFKDLFLHADSKKFKPIDAALLYEEFMELTPLGEEGDKVIASLANRLMEAELLDRAAGLLEHQIKYRLKGADGLDTSMQVAAIRLLDNDPKRALEALENAEKFMKDSNLIPDEILAFDHAIGLLRTRAYTQQKQYAKALQTLDQLLPDGDVYRMQADIAWKASEWTQAALAIDDIILDEEIAPDAPLTKEQASLLLNYAVALNLSSDRVGLANLRNQYAARLSKTDQAALFDVVSRERPEAVILADRATLENIITEVDMFRGFLDKVKSNPIPKIIKTPKTVSSPAPVKTADQQSDQQKEDPKLPPAEPASSTSSDVPKKEDLPKKP